MSVGTRTKGFALSALGVLPITYNWEVYARGGVLFGSNTESIFGVNQEGFPVAAQFSESSTDFLAGVGASYMLAEVYQLRAEFQRIFDAGAGAFGEADLDLMTVGITVKF
jgi:OmpA-like transmembrane domain